MSHITNISARDAKNRFGELLDAARIAPVEITKHGKGVAVMLPLTEYRRFLEADDALWSAKAKAAHDEGYLSAKDSGVLLKQLLDARD